jgi:predicted Rossmann-fold nucleotide-binding protein
MNGMSKVLKIGVYGSAGGGIGNDAIAKARELGKIIAGRGHAIVTGACHGLPHEAVLGAINAGGNAIGFSPATSIKEHLEIYKMPADGELVFVPANYEHAGKREICLKYRNISSTAFADCGIIIGGRTGTMNEVTLLYDFNKPIGVLEGTGGITDGAIRKMLECIDKKGPRVIFSPEPKALVAQIEQLFL